MAKIRRNARSEGLKDMGFSEVEGSRALLKTKGHPCRLLRPSASFYVVIQDVESGGNIQSGSQVES